MKQIIFTILLSFTFCFSTSAQNNQSSCPQIKISVINEYGRAGEFVFFIAELGKETDRYNVEYNWTVDNSKNLEIIGGQRTRVLQTLRKTGDVGTVAFEINGLPENCKNWEAESISAIDPPYPLEIDQFENLSQGALKARMDNFFAELQDRPDSNGLIIASTDQNTINQVKFLSKYIGWRNFDKKKISFLFTDELKNLTRLFIIPEGAYNPTFDNSLIIKAEDFDKVVDLFQPKTNSKNRKK